MASVHGPPNTVFAGVPAAPIVMTMQAWCESAFQACRKSWTAFIGGNLSVGGGSGTGWRGHGEGGSRQAPVVGPDALSQGQAGDPGVLRPLPVVPGDGELPDPFW